ncbi:hypothetical protein Ahy_B05g075686 [Arachis hypogaea]|uniref:CCHC-type domain-containing protein n=1 Tax=Arachis hypogaea TaxID=3818 RepID=A0A444Z242_ARAHY|nr:hypothetical protein Ahy_B05g075686 [Arachis hypogaea]
MNSIEGRVIKLNKPGELGYKKDCLNVAGKIISDKEISFKTCKNALLEMWDNPQSVAVTDIGSKKMLFSFKDRKIGLQIMQNEPWNVRENMVNLRLWREGESVFEVDHDFIEFWIQIHGIPHNLMDRETGTLIGEILGVLVEAKDPRGDGVLRRPYLRIRVSINITKALPTGFWLDREELPPLWVFFRYERLPDSYCFNCGILGHEKMTCKNPTAMACWDPTKKKYSLGLGQNLESESGEKQSSEESRIRAEQAQQQKIREKSVRENQIGKEEDMSDAEEQVEKVPEIPDFQGVRDSQHDLGAVYKLKNLIEEIRERNNEWAKNKKVQKGEMRNEAQKPKENGPTQDIRPRTGENQMQARNVDRSGLNNYTTEEGENGGEGTSRIIE